VITAIDTSVLLDLVTGDALFGQRSRAALRECQAEGSLIACDVVWAEVAGAFPDVDMARETLTGLRVSYSAMSVEAALAAGRAWRNYRSRGGSRTRVTSDFLIAAHALDRADRLLTRDRGFSRTYFPDLEILDPSRS
jgi:predicted nucleic acid-binding protein